MGTRCGALLFVLVATAQPVLSSGAFEVIDLGAFETGSWGNDINDRSEIVGESKVGPEPFDFPLAFRWHENGGMRPLPLGLDGRAAAINDRGEIVGTCTDITLRQFPCLWTRGGVTDLGSGGVWCWASDLNARGHVVGRCRFGDSGPWHAFLWTPKRGLRDLGAFGEHRSSATAINSRDEVVGSYCKGPDSSCRPFFWSERRGFIDLGTLGGAYGYASDINQQGQVVGASDTANGERHAFLWSEDAGIQDLIPVEGTRSAAYGINDLRQVVGSTFSEGHHRAFVWSEEEGRLELAPLAGTYSSARAINNRGEIVGNSSSDSGYWHACLWRPVPPVRH